MASSDEFAKFARDWDFIHLTSSPHYARSNGLTERAVGIVKELFAKCKDAGVTEAEAMLNHRNTPNASGISPAQMMTGRLVTRRHELLLTSGKTTRAQEKHLQSKEKNRVYHDLHAKRERADFHPGQHIVTRTHKQRP